MKTAQRYKFKSVKAEREFRDRQDANKFIADAINDAGGTFVYMYGNIVLNGVSLCHPEGWHMAIFTSEEKYFIEVADAAPEDTPFFIFANEISQMLKDAQEKVMRDANIHLESITVKDMNVVIHDHVFASALARGTVQ